MLGLERLRLRKPPEYVTHIGRTNVPKAARAEAFRHPDNPLYWVWHTPIIRATLRDSSRHSGEKLRKIRAEKGVGRPPEVLRNRLQAMQANRPDGFPGFGGEFGA